MNTEKLSALIKGVRQYRHHDWNDKVVCKVWNHGMGRLDLFRFYPEKKIVLVNKSIANRYDLAHLQEFGKELGCEDYKVVEQRYHYPEYYTKMFRLES